MKIFVMILFVVCVFSTGVGFIVMANENQEVTEFPKLEEHEKIQAERKMIRDFIGPRVHKVSCYKKLDYSLGNLFDKYGGSGTGWRIDYDGSAYIETAAHVVIHNYEEIFSTSFPWEKQLLPSYGNVMPFPLFPKQYSLFGEQNFVAEQKTVKFWDIIVLENRPYEDAIPEKIYLEIVGVSINDDVALLKPITREDEIKLEKIPACVLGDYSQIETGDSVFSSSASLGVPWSFSEGHVIKKNNPAGFGGYKFTSAKVENYLCPGGSGGPIFNLAGKVVAMSNAIDNPPFGATYGPPSYRLERLLPILTKGHLIGKRLGIEIIGLRHLLEEDLKILKMIDFKKYNIRVALKTKIMKVGLESRAGVVIMDVVYNSPAYDAGLKFGDVIIMVNGISVVASMEVVDEVHFGPDVVSLGVLRPKRRNYKTITLKVKAEKEDIMFE